MKKDLTQQIHKLEDQLNSILDEYDPSSSKEYHEQPVEFQIDSIIFSYAHMIRSKYSSIKFYYMIFFLLTFPVTIALNVIKAIVCLVNRTTFYVCFDIPDIAESVGSSGQYKILIHSNDHQPPHFHIKSGGINLKFSIEDCSILSKSEYMRNCLRGSDLKKIKKWHHTNKYVLESVWKKFHG